MIKINRIVIFFLFVFLLVKNSFSQVKQNQRYKIDLTPKTEYVDPFLGANGGNVYPGASVPFGMVQVSPDNGKFSKQYTSGYSRSNFVITGFSHTHLSGSEEQAMLDISIMPCIGVKDTSKVEYMFSFADEKAWPGYYSVYFPTPKIKAEVTASEFIGWHRYTFPKTAIATIRFDLRDKLDGEQNLGSYISLKNDSTIVGYKYSTIKGQKKKIYFAAKTDARMIGSQAFADGRNTSPKEFYGKQLLLSIGFSTNEKPIVMLKVATSYTSIQNAEAALFLNSHWNFDKAKKDAELSWNNELSKIDIDASIENKKIFYTSLYKALSSTTIFSDAKKEFSYTDKQKLSDTIGGVYTSLNFSNAYQSVMPLFTILETKKIASIVNSMLTYYNHFGVLPNYSVGAVDLKSDDASFGIIFISQAIINDIPGIDKQKAYDAMVATVMRNDKSLLYYRDFGFVPSDKFNNSVSSTLKYSYVDWSIAQVAKKIKKQEGYNYFIKRAGSYINLFNEKVKAFENKNSKDEFIEGDDLQKQINWVNSWYVPYDINGLIALKKGANNFALELDSFFVTPSKSKIAFSIGQYEHGNTMMYHIPYLYNYVGQPYKTQYNVRYIMSRFYTSNTNMQEINDDNGQLSSWFVFSALGFYPVEPVSGKFILGSPLVNNATIYLPNDLKFVIRVYNNSESNVYVQNVKLNGKDYTKTFISYLDIVNGGQIEFFMGNTPNFKYGSESKDLPVSRL